MVLNTSLIMQRKQLYRTILKWTGAILLVTLLTGSAVFFGARLLGYSKSPDNILFHWLISNVNAFIFTTLFFVFNLASKKWIENRRSLETTTDVILHVTVQTVSSIAALISGFVVTGLLFNHEHISIKQNWEVILLIVIVALLAAMLSNILWYSQQFYRQKLAAEKAKIQTQLTALRTQVNPHFLFNSLNSIASLIRINPDRAEEVTQDLADLFRYSLLSSKKKSVTLAEELESVERFLDIEKARFGNRLTVETLIPDALLNVKVPSFILQPLVENAVKHGLGQTDQPCTISIRATAANGKLELEVNDTGPGFDSTDLNELSHNGIGLANISDRLDIQYGNKAALSIQPQGVQLNVPLNHT